MTELSFDFGTDTFTVDVPQADWSSFNKQNANALLQIDQSTYLRVQGMVGGIPVLSQATNATRVEKLSAYTCYADVKTHCPSRETREILGAWTANREEEKGSGRPTNVMLH